MVYQFLKAGQRSSGSDEKAFVVIQGFDFVMFHHITFSFLVTSDAKNIVSFLKTNLLE